MIGCRGWNELRLGPIAGSSSKGFWPGSKSAKMRSPQISARLEKVRLVPPLIGWDGAASVAACWLLDVGDDDPQGASRIGLDDAVFGRGCCCWLWVMTIPKERAAQLLSAAKMLLLAFVVLFSLLSSGEAMKCWPHYSYINSDAQDCPVYDTTRLPPVIIARKQRMPCLQYL